MAKRFKKDDTVYLPVRIDDVEYGDKWYDYVVKTPAVDGVKAEFPFCVKDEEVKTAEEVAKENGMYTSPCDERYDAQVDLVTARAAIDHLQEENRDLNRKLEVVEAARDGAVDEGLKRKNRVTTMEEVIVALVEKIRGLEGGET